MLGAEQSKHGVIPVRIDDRLKRYVRSIAAHDRDYQHASAELQKHKKARQLAEIGRPKKRAKVKKHRVHIAIANLRKQRAAIARNGARHWRRE